MNTETTITYKKNGNIKNVKTLYDNNSILQNPINSVAIENHNTLLKVFSNFGESYTNNYNN
jgi:hypothetical protein